MLITPRSRPPTPSPFLLLPASRRDEKSRRPPFGLVRPSVSLARSPEARGRNILLPRRSVDSTAAPALDTSLSPSLIASPSSPIYQAGARHACKLIGLGRGRRDLSPPHMFGPSVTRTHKDLNLKHDLEVMCKMKCPRQKLKFVPLCSLALG